MHIYIYPYPCILLFKIAMLDNLGRLDTWDYPGNTNIA